MLEPKQQEKLLKLRDNINTDDVEDFIEPFRKLLNSIGDDASREGLEETPFRFAKALAEYTRGYDEDPTEHLEKTFDVDHKEMVIVKDIEFNSTCEHHLAPFFGVAHVGYIPGEHITGLSKIARMIEGFAHRLQVQERLTTQIVDGLYNTLEAQGAMVVIDAKHYCMRGRGVKKPSASTVTSAVRGSFQKHEVRSEFLDLIKKA